MGFSHSTKIIRSASRRTGLAKLGILAAFVFLGSGCTSIEEYIRNGFKVGPNYQRPPAPFAEHWIDADNPHVISSPVAEKGVRYILPVRPEGCCAKM